MQQPQYGYDKNYGMPGSGASQPTWGIVPGSLGSVSTNTGGGSMPYSGAASSASPYAGSYPPSQDYYPQEYTEYKDPVERAKEKLEKLNKKEKKQERKRKRKNEDAKTAAETLIFLGVWNAILWIVPCFGNKWYTKMFNGFGIGFTQVAISLFSINVNIECKAMDLGFKRQFAAIGVDSQKFAELGPEYQVCKLMQHMGGTHTLQAAKNLACAIPGPEACYIMSTLWWSSYMVIFAFSVSALTSLFASMFLYYYWYVDHLKIVRLWAIGWLSASPFLGVVTFAFYNVIAPDVGDLPRAWTTLVRQANAGTGLGEIQAIGEDVFWNKFGWCWFFVWITVCFSCAGPVVWGMWFIKHPKEDQAELANAEDEVAMEQKIWEIQDQADYLRYGVEPEGAWAQGGYGATGYGATGHGGQGYAGYSGY